jgi:hypothetical protein
MLKVLTDLRFTSVPENGAVYRQGGRDYVLIRSEPYDSKKRGRSTLLTWQGHCATCGDEFLTKSGMNTRGLLGNCIKHRLKLGRRKLEPSPTNVMSVGDFSAADQLPEWINCVVGRGSD